MWVISRPHLHFKVHETIKNVSLLIYGCECLFFRLENDRKKTLSDHFLWQEMMVLNHVRKAIKKGFTMTSRESCDKFKHCYQFSQGPASFQMYYTTTENVLCKCQGSKMGMLEAEVTPYHRGTFKHLLLIENLFQTRESIQFMMYRVHNSRYGLGLN